MSYFTTNLSLNLLVKVFFKKANIWQSYRQNGDCFMHPIRIAHFILKDADLAR